MNTLIHAQNTTEPFRATRDRVIQDGYLLRSVMTDPSLSHFNWARDWVRPSDVLRGAAR